MEEKPRSLVRLFGVLGVIVIVIIGAVIFAGRAPAEFVPGTMITIPAGTSTKEAGNLLVSAHIIRSTSLFQVIVTSFISPGRVVAGDFQFDKTVSVFTVARMLTHGNFGGTQAKITIPEGSSNAEIAKIISKSIPGWNTDEFLAKTKANEGYLFPRHTLSLSLLV